VPNNWLNKAVYKQIALWTLIFLGLIWTLAIFLDHSVVQPIFNEWVMKGHGLASYPMWGYSLLILHFGSLSRVIMLQSILGALATASLMVRLICLAPRLKTLTTTLFLLSIPWLSYMAYAYQMPISSSFVILMLLAFEMAFISGKISWGIIAGVLGGIGQNFRTELLLLPGIILILVLILRRLHWLSFPSIKPFVASIGVALLLQIPWGLNCFFNASRFSLTESNLGHVVYLGLGTLPSNPWKITQSDGFAQETVTSAGVEYSSLSFKGGDYLKQRFIDDLKQDPTAYFKCVGARIWRTVYSPFGGVGLSLTPVEKLVAGQIRVRDLLFGPKISATVAKIESRENLYVSTAKIALSKLYDLIGIIILGNAVSLFGIIGFFVAMSTGPFRLNHPLILFLGIVVIYRFGLNVALYAEGKAMTGAYLCYLPFVANTLWLIDKRRLKVRSELWKVIKATTQKL
jgi:hypothetical protein